MSKINIYGKKKAFLDLAHPVLERITINVNLLYFKDRTLIINHIVKYYMNVMNKYMYIVQYIHNILLLTNHLGKNEIIAPKELIIAQVAKPRGQ